MTAGWHSYRPPQGTQRPAESANPFVANCGDHRRLPPSRRASDASPSRIRGATRRTLPRNHSLDEGPLGAAEAQHGDNPHRRSKLTDISATSANLVKYADAEGPGLARPRPRSAVDILAPRLGSAPPPPRPPETSNNQHVDKKHGQALTLCCCPRLCCRRSRASPENPRQRPLNGKRLTKTHVQGLNVRHQRQCPRGCQRCGSRVGLWQTCWPESGLERRLR